MSIAAYIMSLPFPRPGAMLKIL